jgi:glycosyltransferase involved in cell wall biosynthesis
MEKVSVIIPTYNRFNFLLNTLDSVKKQTYTNLEIIVINDASTQNEYYTYDWEANGIIIIHLEENSKKKFGFACPGGYQRNFGIDIATGKYIAFCDDDDIWFPDKLELQINAMKSTGCKMSSTNGLLGNGPYDANKLYDNYSQKHFTFIQNKYKAKGSNLLDNAYPNIWNRDFLSIHNSMVCSSVVLDREIIDLTGRFIIDRTAEDYEYWLRALKYTDSVYVDDICFYYDNGHGFGQQY